MLVNKYDIKIKMLNKDFLFDYKRKTNRWYKVCNIKPFNVPVTPDRNLYICLVYN